MSDKKKGEVWLRNVRLSFEHLFTPSSSVKEGQKKYRANFLIDPDTKHGKRNVKNIKKAIKEIEMEEWGKTGIRYKDGRISFLDGEDCLNSEDEIYDGYEGMQVVKAANPKRVAVFDRDGETPIAEEDDRIYAGCYVNAIVRFYSISDKDKGGNGMFASLEGVQFVKDGEAFGGGSSVKPGTFEDLGDDEDDGDDFGDDDEDDEDERPRRKKSKKTKKSKKRRDEEDDDFEDDEDDEDDDFDEDDDDEDDEDERPRRKKSKKTKKSKKSKKRRSRVELDDDEDEEDDDFDDEDI